LSVDLEEWSDARLAGVPVPSRERLPPSLEEPVARLLDLLATTGARATFFTLGRVARRYPDLVRRIAGQHEIATHGDSHTDVSVLGPARLGREIAESRRRLQDLSGQEVIGYRAPNWSLAGSLDWAAAVFAEQGLRYDSSLIPGAGFLFVRGRRDGRRGPHPLPECPSIWEFPPTVMRLPGLSFTPAGGAFLRALPLGIALGALARAEMRGEVPHVHLHPWEIEPQAQGPSGRARRALLFAGSASLPGKLAAILARWRGTAIETVWAELAGEDASPAPTLGAARAG
jgi:polysaccharide deacetylase family protein (PEP-CTERM system associated)